jgi:hypothetical protein
MNAADVGEVEIDEADDGTTALKVMDACAQVCRVEEFEEGSVESSIKLRGGVVCMHLCMNECMCERVYVLHSCMQCTMLCYAALRCML